LDSTNELETSSTEFNRKIKGFKTNREQLLKVQDSLEKLEELLEVPKIVENCVRSNQWNEAIKVSQRIQQLKKRYHSSSEGTSGSEGILERLSKEVEVALGGLRGKVLESFGEKNLKLPGAVRGVNILRKLNSLSTGRDDSVIVEQEEEGLRIIFLSNRFKCFTKELNLIELQMKACGALPSAKVSVGTHKVGVEENDERSRWIKKWIEIWREIVGETISMYSEVFLSSSYSEPHPHQSDDFLIPQSSLPPVVPLNLFLSSTLDSLAKILNDSLPSLTSTAHLSTLLTQLTYASHSFTRYGFSFASSPKLQLSTLFENLVYKIVINEWELAGKKWEAEWRSGWNKSGGTALIYTTIHRTGQKHKNVPIKDWLVIPEGVQSLLSTPLPSPPGTFKAFSSVDSEWSSNQPLSTLSLIPPITHLLNSYVSSLNSLRLLPPRSIFLKLLKQLSKELERCSRVLEAFVDAWLQSYIATTPPPSNNSFTSPTMTTNGENGSGIDEISEEESLLMKERFQEREIILKSLGWFGRELVIWLRNALVKGIYGELQYSTTREGGGEEAVEEGLVEARKRIEKLIARIEGRDWVDPDSVVVSEMKEEEGTNSTNGDDAPEPPILETIPASPLDSQMDASESNGVHKEHDGEVVERPIDFAPTEPPLLADAEASLLESNGGESQTVTNEEDEANVPYLVDEVAPPPPIPIQETEEIKVE
jgi:hypothetical protein